MNKSPDIDRGWAYVILVGYFLTRCLVLGMSLSPGILYEHLLGDYFESPRALIAWTINLNSFMLYMSANIASSLIRAYGSRVTMMMGCLVSTAGLLGSSFARDIVQVLLFYGIVTGFGYSLINVSCYPVIAEYFVKYRGVVLLLASSGEGVGQFVLPYLFHSLSNAYTWKGALFVMAGLNLNFLVVAATFMPPRLQCEESEKKMRRQSKDRHFLSGCRVDSAVSSAVSCLKTSIMDDVMLFRNYFFVLIFYSYLFNAIGFVGMLTLVKAFGTQKGLTDMEATTLLSFLGLFSLIGTALMTLLLKRLNVLVLNVSFGIGIGVSTIILGLMKTKAAVYIIVAIAGIFSGSIAAFPLVILTIVGVQNIAAGIGYASIAIGIGCATGGPIGAALLSFDPTYTTSFATLGVLGTFGALLQIPLLFARDRLKE